MMEYKSYVASIEFDSVAGLFHGEVINTRDVITFQGTSVVELREEFANSVDDYLAFCAERGEEPDRPYPGKLALRLDPELHRAVALCAARDKSSINAWIVSRLREHAFRPLSLAARDMPISPSLSAPVELAIGAGSFEIISTERGKDFCHVWRQNAVVTSHNPAHVGNSYKSDDTLFFFAEEPVNAS